MAIKSVSIRIDSEMLDKLHVVADYEGCSVNSQILILIRDCLQKYEEQPERSKKNSRARRGSEDTRRYHYDMAV